MRNSVFYIDPQGGSGNLGMYDYELLSRVNYSDLYFFGEKTYDYLVLPNVICKFWFKYGKYKNLVLKGLSYILTMLQIMWMVIKIQPKAIHIQWIRIPGFDIIYYKILKTIFGIKTIYTVHNILPHETKEGDKQLYKKMYELSDVLIVHTETTKKLLITEFNISPTKIFIAPHGPLQYRKDPLEVEKEVKLIKDEFQLDGKIVFAMVGYQSEYKGTDLLVKAWDSSNTIKERDDVALVIAGNHTCNFIKENQIENIKVMDGFISDLTFAALLKMSDVIVLPYRKIEQSGVLLTLVLQHKPYCTTDVGELTKPILKENIGWIIPQISSEAIRNTLEFIISHPEEIKKCKENTEGWKRIEDYYDWKHAANITHNIYINI